MAVDDDLPWTTSRCYRLLRPLSSKLAKLRKELERPSSPSAEGRKCSSAFAIIGSPHKTTNFTRPAHKPRGFDKASDPDWRPGPKQGAGKKTYGGRGAKRLGLNRGASDNNQVSRPGEIAFTPLVNRIGSQLHSSPQVQTSPLRRYAKNRGPLCVDIDRIKAQGDLYKLIQGLLEAYANILKATGEGNERKWNGTRSLMGACLRKLPAYIELEEHFAALDRAENEEEEEKDTATEIYEHLEAQFEQRAGQGWRPFKQVVRAHATNLMCSAISEGTISLESVSILAGHCLNVSAWAEAEELLLAYLPLLEHSSMPINLKADLFDAQKSVYMATLKTFVDRTGRYRLLYDVLEHLIALELLPLEWLATECMRPMWDRLARSVSQGDPRMVPHTLRFLETVTLAGMGLPDERLLADEATGGARRFAPSSRAELRLALDTTYSSLLTVLSSIALVNNGRADEEGQNSAQRIGWLLNSICTAIIMQSDIQAEMKMLQPDAEDVQTYAQRAIRVIFANLVVQLDGCLMDSTFAHRASSVLVNYISTTAQQYPLTGVNLASILGSLPELVSSVARGTGRIWKDDGFDQLQRLVQALLSLSGCRLPHKLWTTKRLALESAVEFAHALGGAQYLTYARDIEMLLHTQGRLVIMPSPQKNGLPPSGGGFRWEEGIGEWVACTPFVKQGVQRKSIKSVPAIQLLPTPIQSDDEQDAHLPAPASDDSSMWQTTDYLDHNDEDEVPFSSPIKERKRPVSTAKFKRKRASSPMVVIAAKRVQLTPPDSPPTFYADLPEQRGEGDGPRRSRRSRHEIKRLTSRLRTQRSRTSVDSGLRDLVRRTYTEQAPLNDDDSGMSACESDSQMEDADSIEPDSESIESPGAWCAVTRATTSMKPQTDGACDHVEEKDDLGITPARPRPQRQVRRKASERRLANRSWRKAKTKAVRDSDYGSEDELSFH